jgi:hypothetical protein
MSGFDRPEGQIMDISSLRAILDSEKNAAMAAYRAGKLSVERTKALDYYLGDITSDVTSEDGRSSAVSFDVSDTIEGMLPPLLDMFCSGDEVVRLEPKHTADIELAQQESDFLNFVFMEQNPGFMILYTMIKDALMSKTGIVKVYWDVRMEEEQETFYDLDEAQFAMLASDPDNEIIAHTEKDRPDANDPDTDPSTNPSYS